VAEKQTPPPPPAPTLSKPLASLLLTDVPELGLTAEKPAPKPTGKPPKK
jgi:hypothetical protein